MIAAAKLRKRLTAWQRSRMDCGDEGCGECRVCRRLEFLEWVGMVAPRDIPCSVEIDQPVDAYIRRVYPHVQN